MSEDKLVPTKKPKEETPEEKKAREQREMLEEALRMNF
mgnify:CR=1 FL=1